MKKNILLLFLAILLLLPYNASAWKGNYNYEVTSFQVQGRTATISGWAIQNGRNPSGAGKVRTSYQSGDRNGVKGLRYYINGSAFDDGYCDGGRILNGVGAWTKKNGNVVNQYNPSVLYQYSLSVYRVYNDGRADELVNGATSQDLKVSRNQKPVSVTYVDSIKNGSTGQFKSNETACYEDVGWMFDIDLSKLVINNNIKGYKLRLKIKSRAAEIDIDLTFVGSSDGSNSQISDGYFQNKFTSTVNLLVTSQRAWRGPYSTSGKRSKQLRKYGTYSVKEIQYNSSDGYSWYHIYEGNTDEGWVPTPWVNPTGEATLIKSQGEIYDDVDTKCSENNIKQTEQTKRLTCSGSVTFGDKTQTSCSVSSNQFYTISCSENLTTKFNPQMISEIYTGLGFSYEININSNRSCSGTFNYNAFMEAYNKVRSNINKAPKNSEAYYENLNKLEDLRRIVNTYNSWASNYNLNSVKATLTTTGETSKLLKKINGGVLSVNFVTKSESSNPKLNKTKTYNLSSLGGVSNPSDWTFTDYLTKVLQLPVGYMNRDTEIISYTPCENCAVLENRYYIPSNKNLVNKKFTYTVSVENLGLDKVWQANAESCDLTVIDKLVYRSINLSDPFIKANTKRETGRNWLNDDFDFRKVISTDTWKDTTKPYFVFMVSKENIKKIKTNNNEIGIANAYAGSQCHYNDTTKKYVCSFLRDKTYFASSYIYSDN